MSDKLADLQKIISDVKSHQCSLRAGCLQAVPGEGNPDSPIVFIGEGPGRVEDQEGRPFVGPAGHVLVKLLASIGLKREDVCITNVVKCRPPDNRVPNQKERETCRDYLEQELAILKPKIICVMGNTAYNSLLDGKDITKNRGKFLEKDGKLYFITIHPAATIYNQELVSILKEDIKTLHDKLKK